jgi:hypothetical protein
MNSISVDSARRRLKAAIGCPPIFPIITASPFSPTEMATPSVRDLRMTLLSISFAVTGNLIVAFTAVFSTCLVTIVWPAAKSRQPVNR